MSSVAVAEAGLIDGTRARRWVRILMQNGSIPL